MVPTARGSHGRQAVGVGILWAAIAAAALAATTQAPPAPGRAPTALRP